MACCNVGANKPEDFWNYYAWGETQTKREYTVDTYLYDIGDFDREIAGTDHDAATANWGAPWQMPSKVQIQELLDNTTSIGTTQNGVKGRKFTGNNGESIFLPFAGQMTTTLYNTTSGYYWSSTAGGSITRPNLLAISMTYSGMLDLMYSYGLPIRPVR